MSHVKADYRQLLLSHIGGHLHKMKFFYCFNIDPIAELLHCAELKNLEIKISSFIPHPSHRFGIDAENQFLPSLENLKTSKTCFGDWSSLFECPRPSLTHLILSCSHIGIASKSPLFDWHNIPEMWPNLQVLVILSNSNLTLDKLEVSLNFEQLQFVMFPSTIFNQSVNQIGIEETMNKVSTLLLARKSDGTISSTLSLMFIGGPSIINCPFIPVNI